MGDFGRYQVIKPLGCTEVTELFLAHVVELDGFNKQVILEKLIDAVSQDANLGSQFIGDATRAITVEHPNVAQIYDFGAQDGTFFLAREVVYGCGLDGVQSLPFVNGHGLSPPIALLIIQEVLNGLDAMHGPPGQGPNLNHGALCPTRVLLSVDGAVKVSGLALGPLIARLVASAPARVPDQLGYLAPEQVVTGQGDARSDVFACGVMLWELLTGRRMHTPSATANALDLLRRAKEARIEPPRRHNPNVPQELQDLVMGALARDPSQRIAGTKDFGRLIFNYLMRHHGEASLYLLQEFLEQHRAGLPIIEITSPETLNINPESPAGAAQARSLEAALAQLAVSEFSAPTGLGEAVEAFRRNPRLWQLVEMGDIYQTSDQNEAALSAFRVAAVLFAQRGLLAHSLLCCKRMLGIAPFQSLRQTIVALPTVSQASNEEVQRLLYPAQGPVENLLQEMLAGCAPAHGLVGAGTPLLSYLHGEAFAKLAQEAPLRSFPDGGRIVSEGEPGSTLYLMGRGRVVVYATNAHQEPVYLSSLTVGDFFGENSFFTGALRSASVECLGDVEAFEIGKALYERVMGDNLRTEAALLDFYKERIVNAVLAKSQIFGLLPSEERQALVYKFLLRVFQPEDEIIREGDIHDSIFLIKSGEAEVFTKKGGPRTRLSFIGPGTVFGEVAALRNIPRTASVVATTTVEVLELAGASFHAVLLGRPDLQQKVVDVVAKRARENLDKVFGSSPWRR